MILPASYANGFAPRDGQPLYAELWRGCVGAWNPGLGPSGLTLRDWSGFGGHGQMTNFTPATDWSPLRGKYALQFNGSTKYVDFGSSPVLTGIASSFIVSMWIVPQSLSRGDLCGMFDDAAGLANSKFVLSSGITSGKFVFYISSGAFLRNSGDSTTTYSTGSLYHVAGVYDDANDLVEIWVNGRLENSAAAAMTLNTTSINSLVLGCSEASSGSFRFNGSVLDFSMHTGCDRNIVRRLATRPGIAYELAPRRRSSSAVQFNRRRRLLLGAQS